jgi:sugar lactone lactonase YvrE
VTKTLHTTLLVDGFVYGEGPRWHDGRLWFTDCPTGTVKTVDLDGRMEVAIETEHPSGLGWLPDGSMLISTLYEAKIKRADADGVRVIHDFGDRAWSTNDMVVAPDGRAYVDLYSRTAAGIAGEVALVTPDGEVRVVATELATPNGLAITPDGCTLLVSETFAGRVLAFPIEADGSLGDRRVFAELGEGRHPDGLCMDAAGAVWVGCYDSREFLRILDGGEVTHRIETPAGWAVAPALGGPDRRSLYLVVNETTHEGLSKGESSGRIEAVRVEVSGAGSP